MSDDLQATLPIIDFSSTKASVPKSKKKIDETFAKIRQLHDELNTQLYSSPKERPVITSPSDAFHLLDCFIGYLDHEEMWVVNMNQRNRVVNMVKLYQGSVNSSQVRVAEIFRQAIIDNCSAIMIAHNHPSSYVEPSPDDVKVTRAIVQAGKLLDIVVLDHIIISHGAYTSLKEKSLGFS